MKKDPVTDTSQQDTTLDKDFINEQIDRLLGWEILNRYLNHQNNLPLEPLKLCDKIGVDKQYVHRVIKTVKYKLNAK